MQELIKKYIVPYFGGSNAEVPLEALDDAAVIDGIVLKSDVYAVKPIFFPGGDIGRLAVAGTVNDIAVMGARPLALACGLVLEEGFLIADLERILASMRECCRRVGVHIITGDIKVMEKGAIDEIVISVSGIGKRYELLDTNFSVVERIHPVTSRWLVDTNIYPGDIILVSGSIGDHGISLISHREGYDFKSSLTSDTQPLNGLVEKVLQVGGIVKIKDPTRGGLANTLNEWSEKSQVGITVSEESIPIHENVRAACEMLGIDPLEVGNEGKLVVAVTPPQAEEALQALRSTEEGREAAIIGEATDRSGYVIMETTVGGKRIIPPPAGDPIPRIC